MLQSIKNTMVTYLTEVLIRPVRDGGSCCFHNTSAKMRKACEYTHDSYLCSQAFYLRTKSVITFLGGADSIIQVGSDSLLLCS